MEVEKGLNRNIVWKIYQQTNKFAISLELKMKKNGNISLENPWTKSINEKNLSLYELEVLQDNNKEAIKEENEIITDRILHSLNHHLMILNIITDMRIAKIRN
ncbi:hypothetical protein WUBG_17583 [Wuchereria bancrofti]|uniref:Uncharacterized protein n=1 Tax=Wuchereria bancrofti TaxID=6293 RepID=J9ABX8_WUCBA|nr:hypothetical protein WUBG_17583 [Wuchereria bancrofti]